jgi:hypothetical protein
LNCGSLKFRQASTIKNQMNKSGSWDIGGKGGKCTCPDGQVYFSGVKRRSGGCTAENAAYGCVGGIASDCKPYGGSWSRVKIICGKSLNNFWSNSNSRHYKAADSSDQRCTSNNCKKWGWDELNKNWDHKTVSLGVVSTSGCGGTCKCPDGKTFLVTATDDTCTSIACDGGTIIDCTDTADDKWLDQQVSCGKLLHTPTTCTECWTKDDITKDAYDTWEGKDSYTLKQLSSTDTDHPFKLLGGTCLMNCTAGHWSNWELDPDNPRPDFYAPNVYNEFDPFAGNGGTTDCTCPDGQKFATAVESGQGCDSIDTLCKHGVVPADNDCHSTNEGLWTKKSVTCGKKLEFTTDPYNTLCTSDNCRSYNFDEEQ